jgi:hypothetical protein
VESIDSDLFAYVYMSICSNEGWGVVPDCSWRECAYDKAWADRAYGDDQAHSLVRLLQLKKKKKKTYSFRASNHF